MMKRLKRFFQRKRPVTEPPHYHTLKFFKKQTTFDSGHIYLFVCTGCWKLFKDRLWG